MNRLLPALLALFISAPLAAFEVVVTIQHATCGGSTGSIYSYATGGVPPYTYTWNTGANTPSIFDVSPGFYTVTVMDSNADEVMSTVELVATTALFPPFTPSAPAWSCDDECNGYVYYNIPLSGLSMNVEFDPPGPIGNASPNGLFLTNLCPGTEYMVTVSDINGCSSTVGPIEVLGSMAPELLSSALTGSCPGGATGTMLLEFDMMDSLIVNGPGGVLAEVTTNPFYAENLEAGTYMIYAYVGSISTPPGTTGPECSMEFTIEIPVSTDPCGSVSGVVYADLGGDCVQDPGDLGLPYRILAIEPGGHLALTNAIGEYATELFYDDYSLDATIADYDVICPTLPAAFTMDAINTSEVIDLAMDPLFGADVSSHLSAGVHRPGFPVTYYASVHNEGPFAFTNLIFDLFFDPILTLVDAPGSPVLVGPGHLQWTIASFPGFSEVVYAVEFTIPNNTGLIGTVVAGSTTVSTEVPDAHPENNTYSITRTIVGSYDPNDKLAATSSLTSGSSYYLDLDSWVDYTVRFQNSGTAEAINVHITDTIAMELDLLSLQILGASHTFEASLLPGRVLRFDFPNIMLPDSGADYLGSQGFASFRLKPVSGLLPSTVLSNAADIFFDFNDPIRTNDADLVIELSTGIDDPESQSVQLRPNPATDRISFTLEEGYWTMATYSMDGREIMTTQGPGGIIDMDVSGIAPGAYVLRAVQRSSGRVLQAPFVKQ